MKKTTLLLSALVMSFSAVSFAADAQWEIWSGGLASLDFTNNFPSGTAGSGTTINLFNTTNFKPAISYTLGGGLQVKLAPAFNSFSASGSTVSTFDALIGLTYNFGAMMDDSFFVEALVGYYSYSGTTTTSGLSYAAGLGKRFKLVDHVTWAPEVTFKGASITPSGTAFSVIPVQFTFMM